MFSWRWRKKDRDFEKKAEELDGRLHSGNRKEPEATGGAGRAEQEIVDRLEQMMDTAKGLEERKAEYQKLTAYLNDVQYLEDLKGVERRKIEETAVNVVQLNRARTGFLNSAKKLTDAQFVQMEMEEDGMPAAINRLSANEAYHETLTRDLKYLDREKSEWAMRKEFLGYHRNRLKNMLYVFTGIAVTAAVVLAILQGMLGLDLRYGWMAFALLTAVIICTAYLRLQDDSGEIHTAERNLNRAIALQNKVKIKYVNVKNAIDYACEKYHVRNSMELKQQWEHYLEAVKERERFQRTNEDLEYFNDKLLRLLAGHKLYNSRVWIAQAAALVDPKEMVEIKHALITKRQKVRGRIEFDMQTLKDEEREIQQLLGKVGERKPQIEGILSSIGKLGGTKEYILHTD